MNIKKLIKPVRKFGSMRKHLSKVERTPLRILIFASSPEKAALDLSLLLGQTESWFETLAFVDASSVDSRLYTKVSEADAVLIYSDEVGKEIDGLSRTVFFVSEATFRWKLLLVGSGTDIYARAISAALNINRKHIVVVEQKLKLIEAAATGLINIIPDGAIYSACANRVLREAVYQMLPEVAARLLLKSLLAPAVFGPFGLKIAYDEFAELIKVMGEFYPHTRLTDERVAALVLVLAATAVERPVSFMRRVAFPALVYGVLKLLRKVNSANISGW